VRGRPGALRAAPRLLPAPARIGARRGCCRVQSALVPRPVVARGLDRSLSARGRLAGAGCCGAHPGLGDVLRDLVEGLRTERSRSAGRVVLRCGGLLVCRGSMSVRAITAPRRIFGVLARGERASPLFPARAGLRATILLWRRADGLLPLAEKDPLEKPEHLAGALAWRRGGHPQECGSPSAAARALLPEKRNRHRSAVPTVSPTPGPHTLARSGACAQPPPRSQQLCVRVFTKGN
jgi:hypothetical protein